MSATDQASSDPLRVLFIGNSQFSKWDIPGMVQELSASDTPLLCEGCLIGGSWLQTHLDSPDTMGSLETGDWDKVVLQEHFRAPEEENREKSLASATDLCGRISNLKATPVLYASPGIESDGPEGFIAIHSLNLELARELDVTLAGAGAACLRVWKEMPELDLHDRDRRHPNDTASYIGACVLYAALTEQSPVGLPYRCGEGMVSEDEALLFQQAAWDEFRETNAERQTRSL